LYSAPEILNLSQQEIQRKKIILNVIEIDNEWEFEIKPVLDNTWGDYRIPAFNGKIGSRNVGDEVCTRNY
jgi:hypothetical protein